MFDQSQVSPCDLVPKVATTFSIASAASADEESLADCASAACCFIAPCRCRTPCRTQRTCAHTPSHLGATASPSRRRTYPTEWAALSCSSGRLRSLVAS